MIKDSNFLQSELSFKNKSKEDIKKEIKFLLQEVGIPFDLKAKKVLEQPRFNYEEITAGQET